MKYTGTSGDLIESRKSIATANAPNTAIHAKKKTMPRIDLNDGQHQLIIAKNNERVLTPQQNETWESVHPNARKEPLKANVYDGGGNVSPLIVAQESGSSMGSVPQGMVRSDAPNADTFKNRLKNFGKNAGNISFPEQDESMIPIEQPVSYFDGGGRVGNVTTNPEQLIKQGKALHEEVENPMQEKQANIDAYRRSTEPQSQSAMPRIREVSSKDLINPASRYGARSGEKRIYTDAQGSEIDPRSPEGMGAAGVRKPYLPTLPIYDTGGIVETEEAPGQRDLDREQIQPSAGAARQAPSTPLGYVGKYTPTEPAPAQSDLDRAQIKEVHQKADDLQDAGLKTNNISQVGLGQIYHNLADKRTPSYLPRVEAPAATPEPTAPTGIGSTGAAPSGQLIPEMPAYIGQERIGKGTPGEKQLISDRQTDVDHLKYVMAHGTREEAANAEEQLARLEKGTPWGSASNHPGFGGKLGHILGRIGETALSATAPYVNAAIPGSQLNLNARENEGIGKIKELGQERLTAAETGLKQAQTQKELRPEKPEKEDDKEKFVQQFLSENKLPDSATNRGQALQAYAVASQAPEKKEKENDKEKFVQQFLSEKKLPDNSTNRAAGLKAYAAATQAPERPPQSLMTVPDGKGGYTVINAKPGMTISGETTKLGTGAAHFAEPVAALNPKTGKYEVMERGNVPKGAFAYKIDPATINSNAGRMDDVQNKINNLAVLANSVDMTQVNQALVGAAMDEGTKLNFEGLHLDTGRLNAVLSEENIKNMNGPTRDYIIALLGAHEAVTNLPGLQTFGKSNRMTETQMKASQKMLPEAGDDADMARRKMKAFQGMLDPLRKHIITLPDQPLLPSFMEEMHEESTATPSFADWKKSKK